MVVQMHDLVPNDRRLTVKWLKNQMSSSWFKLDLAEWMVG